MFPSWVDTWSHSLVRFNLTGTVAVAVSGGPDSMALVKLMQAFYPSVVAVTVDHQLRSESRSEAEQVQKWMHDWGLEHTILTWQEPSVQRLQERARQARYELMGQWCRERGINTLMTAHHQDDDIETFWMRVFKGSGPAGLCGMKSERPLSFGRLIRPLLGVSRGQLKEALGGDAFYVQDPSNNNTQFERVRCRQWIQDNPDKKAAALRSMAQFQQTESYIQEHVREGLQKYAHPQTCFVSGGWQDLPSLISQRMWQVLARQIGLGAYPMSHDLCQRVDASLRRNQSITGAGVWFRPSQSGVSLQKEAERRSS